MRSFRWNRWMTLGVIALLGLLVFLILTQRDPAEAEPDTYVVSYGNSGPTIRWELDNHGVLTVSGTGEMESFMDAYGRRIVSWGGDLDQIRAVTIEEGITTVGPYAFMNCANLETVTLPPGLTRIGACAFQNCANLRSVSLPDGLETIWGGAFSGCRSLSELTLPASVREIGGDAFDDTQLTDLIAAQATEEQGTQRAREHGEDRQITAAGWREREGKWYYYNALGQMRTGWLQLDGTWYYLEASGAMHVGWLTLGSAEYYFDESGAMLTGEQTIGNHTYTFGEDGRRLP